MEQEIWKSIHGYEGLYEISTEGRVKRLERIKVDTLGRKTLLREKILTNRISKQTGYPCVNLSKDGMVKTYNIHSLIADAFIPNPDNLPCINHIDEDRTNSVLSNLERCTYKYNMMYGSAPQKRRESLKKHYIEHNYKSKGIVFGTSSKVNQYSLGGEFIAHFEGGASEVMDTLGYNKSAIGACCRHKSRQAYGYVWRYDGDPFSYEAPKYNFGKVFANCSPKKHQKYVIKTDADGKEIERYKSVSEAGRKNGFDRHLLSKRIVNGIAIVDGMRFIVEKKENEYIPKGHSGPRPDLRGKCAKAISQYTKDGVFIRDFSSAKEAALFIGKNASDITNCCKGNLKTAHGFIWTYKGCTKPNQFVDNSKRAIEQYRFDGTFVAKYESIREAINTLGRGTPSCIGNNLSGRSHSAYGFIWKYKTD